jgi:acetyltransferase-like isoleucine patch superfamily enzyme
MKEKVNMEIGSSRRMLHPNTSWAAKFHLARRLSPAAALSLARRLLWARWSLRQATSVGKYVKLVGHLRVDNRGRLLIGNQVLFHAQVAKTELAVLPGGELRIGNGAFINYGTEICAQAGITIGDECRIGTHCIIMDNDFHYVDLARRDLRPPGVPVIIEPHVWVGNRVTILKGVHIGYGSVIAAGSVVTRSIPPMSIAAGVPARVIGRVADSTAPDGATGAVDDPAQQHPDNVLSFQR